MDLGLPLFVRSIFSACDLNIFSIFTSPPREGKCNVVFSVVLLFHNYLPHLYFYASESCPVQLFPFCWPRRSERTKMPRSSIVFWFPHDWDGFLSVPVRLCIAIGCHQCEKDTHILSYFFSKATRGSVMKGLFKRQKSSFVLRNVFTKPATDSPVYYEPCILIGGCR